MRTYRESWTHEANAIRLMWVVARWPWWRRLLWRLGLAYCGYWTLASNFKAMKEEADWSNAHADNPLHFK